MFTKVHILSKLIVCIYINKTTIKHQLKKQTKLKQTKHDFKKIKKHTIHITKTKQNSGMSKKDKNYIDTRIQNINVSVFLFSV